MKWNFNRKGTRERVSIRQRDKMHRTVEDRNRGFIQSLMCICIENGGSVRVKRGTFVLLDSDDQLRFDVDPVTGDQIFTYVPKEEPDGSGRLGKSSEADEVPGRESNVGGSLREAEDVDRGTLEEVRRGVSDDSLAVGSDGSLEEAPRREEQPDDRGDGRTSDSSEGDREDGSSR